MKCSVCGCTEFEEDKILFFCETCKEEYELPEEETICPICGNATLEEI